MKRMLVYSHDTFGLGNIRRMLAICSHVAKVSPDLSILLVTGSPFVQNFRLPQGLDYIKLPSLTRIDSESYRTAYLDLGLNVTIRLRAAFLRGAVEAFCPDLILVDKKPLGIKNELKPALAHLKRRNPHARAVLILRDILDSAEATIRTWRNKGYYSAISRLYDQVAVLGSPEIFDVRREYRLPEPLARKTYFCGYIRREPGRRDLGAIRMELNLANSDPFVVVTAGGGEDSACLMEAYVAALPLLEQRLPGLTSLVICGPAIPEAVKHRLTHSTRSHSKVILREFTDDLMSYMAAANLVVSMGGYNTVCELLTLAKRAIVVPRVRPVQEQWIRAERMERLGLFRVLHPDVLTPNTLADNVASEIAFPGPVPVPWVDLNGLERIGEMVRRLEGGNRSAAIPAALTAGPADHGASNGFARMEAI